MPNFEDGSTHYYNQDFTLEELNNVLSSVSDSAPGEDAITYEMIKNLPNHVHELLIEMFNKFKKSFYPNKWKRAQVTPALRHSLHQCLKIIDRSPSYSIWGS